MTTDAPDCGLNKGAHVDCRGEPRCKFVRWTPCVVCGATVVSRDLEYDLKAVCSIICWDKMRGNG